MIDSLESRAEEWVKCLPGHGNKQADLKTTNLDKYE